MRGHNDAPIQAVPMMAIKITVTNQNNELVYKRPLWLIVVADWPHDWSIKESWYSYNHRFDLEHYFRFGKNREGDVKQLIRFENLCSYKVVKPEPLLVNKKIVSSTLIRNLLQKGNLENANKNLDRSWSIEGKSFLGSHFKKP